MLKDSLCFNITLGSWLAVGADACKELKLR